MTNSRSVSAVWYSHIHVCVQGWSGQKKELFPFISYSITQFCHCCGQFTAKTLMQTLKNTNLHSHWSLLILPVRTDSCSLSTSSWAVTLLTIVLSYTSHLFALPRRKSAEVQSQAGQRWLLGHDLPSNFACRIPDRELYYPLAWHSLHKPMLALSFSCKALTAQN